MRLNNDISAWDWWFRHLTAGDTPPAKGSVSENPVFSDNELWLVGAIIVLLASGALYFTHRKT
jgi:hypothetical protein